MKESFNRKRCLEFLLFLLIFFSPKFYLSYFFFSNGNFLFEFKELKVFAFCEVWFSNEKKLNLRIKQKLVGV